ncbi:DegT/DnrJ/EryC1/StrS aminotransferase family protein [uncultured Roseobacter sp.]|uniref:DegT/DnrJ/EryC1/StrS family aminotransferase n=1 Tax=uncultured Roseobacter sp. TaxID=114847 RepID=UPI0026339F42|nr:DegT/DnrJ/EryC1/StrS family aminotransferase [uncultured Roseobacter sp.]
MTDVPFLDLGESYRALKPEIDEAVARVLTSGWYVLGEEVESFEKAFARYCGASHAVGLANGLDGLHLALRALGIGEGDEVIVPSNGYIATWLGVSLAGATPIPVEPDPLTHNIDPVLIEAAITPRTRAIMALHLYGLPADLAPIMDIAGRHGLRVVEDAAQAHGARYHGDKIGHHGDIVAWSFYPSKNLGALGDAGAVTTKDADLAERIRTLRNYGSQERYVNRIQGVNSRLDPIQAAVLRVKLNHLDAWNAHRAKIAARYAERLGDASNLTLPVEPEGLDSAWHLYVVRVPQRARVQEMLHRAGIGTQVHYPIPPHMQEAYAGLGYAADDLPIARRLSEEVLSLPCGPQMPLDAVDTVCDKLLESINAI